MTTYVIRNGRLLDKELAPPLVEVFGQGPYVISDEIPFTKHMCDGQHYTSKAKFRETTRAHGCIEVGDDKSVSTPRKPAPLSRDQRKRDIKRAIDQLKAQKRK